MRGQLILLHQPICLTYLLQSDIAILTRLKVTYKCCFYIRCFQLLLFKSLANRHSRLIIYFIIMLLSMKPQSHLKQAFHFSFLAKQILGELQLFAIWLIGVSGIQGIPGFAFIFDTGTKASHHHNQCTNFTIDLIHSQWAIQPCLASSSDVQYIKKNYRHCNNYSILY